MTEEEFTDEKGIDAREDREGAALLIGTYSGASQKNRCEEYLDELENLADTFGIPCVGKLPFAMRKFEASTYLQEGKLDKIEEEIQKTHANLVIFDEEITPGQQRNLEKRLKVAIMDRTELILEIFAQRAQTKEARLQIELARTKYQFPRLKRLWSHFSRQRSGGGFLGGEGEKQLELDKRLLKRKVDRLNQELKEVQRYRETQRVLRRKQGIPTLAIIGYTNAGKSTLLNALTDAKVLVEDKLFATLDPTTRKFMLPNNQEVLLTDTVGFIRKLPHSLVAAFRSTLESALHDDVLLHLIDASHPLADEQANTTLKLLKELGAQEESVLTVLNKIDQCEDKAKLDLLLHKFPKTIGISALKKEGFDALSEMIIQELAKRREVIKLKIPQKEYALVAAIRREGNILYEEYHENDIILRAELPIIVLHRFEPYRYEPETES